MDENKVKYFLSEKKNVIKYKKLFGIKQLSPCFANTQSLKDLPKIKEHIKVK